MRFALGPASELVSKAYVAGPTLDAGVLEDRTEQVLVEGERGRRFSSAYKVQGFL